MRMLAVHIFSVLVSAGAELGITSDGFFELEDLPKYVKKTSDTF